MLAQLAEAAAHGVSNVAGPVTGPATPRTARDAVAREALPFWGPIPQR